MASSNKQSTASNPVNTVTDSRRAVGDQGVLAEGGSFVDQSINDNRTFDDHSVFQVDGSDRSVDNSVTNVFSADPEIAKANAQAAIVAFEAGQDIAREALQGNAGVVNAALEAHADTLSTALTSAERNNLNAFEFARGAGSDALAVATTAFEKAASLISDDAEKSRDFAGNIAAGIFNSAKSADQQIAENITKALTVVFVVGALAWAAKSAK